MSTRFACSVARSDERVLAPPSAAPPRPSVTAAARTPTPARRAIAHTTGQGAKELRLRRRLTRFALVRVRGVARPHIREGHRDRPVLHLPDVAELVADEAVVGEIQDA